MGTGSNIGGRDGRRHLRAALRYALVHRRRFIAELHEFLRFASVSATPANNEALHRCAAWLAAQLRAIGLTSVAVVPTRGHPVVYAEYRTSPRLPAILFYGHYDTHPAGPETAWTSPPFQPVVRSGRLYARGASDDKGQLFMHLKALECVLRGCGTLPVNAAVLLEGEEEIGSPHLEEAMDRLGERLRADAVVISDTSMPAANRPALTVGLRGALGMAIEASGPSRDLHAGLYGGAVGNPAEGLCRLLAGLHDAAGRVAIPGFYDAVVDLPEEERRAIRDTMPTDPELLREAGVGHRCGEAGYSARERVAIRPALTVNGLSCGETGSAARGVIPARAGAALDIRLVTGQEPAAIERLVRRHLFAHCPRDVSLRIATTARADPVIVDLRNGMVAAAMRALQRCFGIRPLVLRSGGSIPAAGTLQRRLGCVPLLMGFGLPADRVHAADESFSLSQFETGTRCCIALMEELATRMLRNRHPGVAGRRTLV